MEALVDNISDGWYNCECFVCGKKMHRKPYWLRKNKHHNYCSVECHRIDKKRYMSGELNHQYGLVGNKNATFKNGKKLSSYGYFYVQALDHPFAKGRSKYIFEHRLIAEKYLLTEENSIEINGKRYLKPEYHVHHKNFDRTDNRPENLEVLTKAEHQALHNKINDPTRKRDEYGRYMKENIHKCKHCKWYTEDAEVCVNDASDHLADFVLPSDGCEEWEGEDEAD